MIFSRTVLVLCFSRYADWLWLNRSYRSFFLSQISVITPSLQWSWKRRKGKKQDDSFLDHSGQGKVFSRVVLQWQSCRQKEKYLTWVRNWWRVMAGRVSSRHSNRRGVGMGSKSQCFGADFRMKLFSLQFGLRHRLETWEWERKMFHLDWYSGARLWCLTVLVNRYCSEFV